MIRADSGRFFHSSTALTSSYDAGNRLTNWNRTTVPPTSPSVQQWSYDNAGNWNSTARTLGNNTTTENRTQSAADQINTIAGNTATHDLKGNLTEYEINSKEYEVEYDLDNRIVKVEVDNDDVEKHRRLVGVLDRSEATCPVGVSRLVEPANQYRYDAFGRRVIRKEGSTNTSGCN